MLPWGYASVTGLSWVMSPSQRWLVVVLDAQHVGHIVGRLRACLVDRDVIGLPTTAVSILAVVVATTRSHRGSAGTTSKVGDRRSRTSDPASNLGKPAVVCKLRPTSRQERLHKA